MEKVSAALRNFDITGQGTIFDAGGGTCTSTPSISAPTTPAGSSRDHLDMEYDVRRAKTAK